MQAKDDCLSSLTILETWNVSSIEWAPSLLRNIHSKKRKPTYDHDHFVLSYIYQPFYIYEIRFSNQADLQSNPILESIVLCQFSFR